MKIIPPYTITVPSLPNNRFVVPSQDPFIVERHTLGLISTLYKLELANRFVVQELHNTLFMIDSSNEFNEEIQYELWWTG